MFRHVGSGKYYYNYKPSENNRGIFFIEDREITLDDEYLCAKEREKEVLDDTSEIIGYYESRTVNLDDKIHNLNRRCRVYERFNQIMDEITDKKLELRVPYFQQIEGVLQAFLFAHDLITEEEVKSDGSTFERDFVMQLADIIKKDWNETEMIFCGLTEEYKREAKQECQNPIEQPEELNEKIEYARKKKSEFKKKTEEDNVNSFGIPYL